MGLGDWGLGIGDWGLGIGDWAQSPIPNPQSPIPNPQMNNIFYILIIFNKTHIFCHSVIQDMISVYNKSLINKNLIRLPEYYKWEEKIDLTTLAKISSC